MKVLIINGSPRGRFSVTLQSCLYLEQAFPEHEFEFLNAGSGIHVFERDMSGATEAVASCDLLIFAYPVYDFLVPSQLHRFIELLKASGADFTGVFASQLSTSLHFYDMTAQRFIEDNCNDMGMRVVKGLSAGTEDLLTEQGRSELEAFFRYAVFCVENEISEPSRSPAPAAQREYECCLEPSKKPEDYDTVIVGDLREEDESLRAMVKDFAAAFPYKTRFVNIADFQFKGGCLGCLNCRYDGRCVYDDGFDAFLADIYRADAIVYAFTPRDHSMGARFKMFDDRGFFTALRDRARGKPTAYIINGEYETEENLIAVLEARSEMSQSFLAGFASNTAQLQSVAKKLAYALEHKYAPPQDFRGIAGQKLLRDWLWPVRGISRADNEYFKAHGLYDFPQRKWLYSLRLSVLGLLMRNEKLRAKIEPRLNHRRLAPYRKLLKQKRGGEKL